MLRYSFLAGFLLLSANTVFPQILWEIEDQTQSIHRYRGLNKFPDWARSFADSTLRKVGVKPTVDLREPVSSRVPTNLPPGVRPVDYIGRDGLPGDPLPAVFMPRSNLIEFDKLRQMMIDSWEVRQPIEEKLKKEQSK